MFEVADSLLKVYCYLCRGILIRQLGAMTANVKVFAIGRVFIERPARTNALLKIFC